MNNMRKLFIGVLVSVVVATLCVFIVYRKIQTGTNDGAKTSSEWHYVAATRDIAAGERLGPDMLTTVNWSSTLPVEGAFNSPDKAVGRIASFPLASGMVVTEKLLASADSSLGLPQKIPEGMRAIAIQTDEVADFGGFLFPGAHVDVLMTIKAVTAGPMMQPIKQVVDRDRTIVVLEDVGVLATGKQIVPDPSGKPTSVSVVTLLVTPDDARKVALAQQKGIVQLALRNGADHGSALHRATYLSDLAGPPAPESRSTVPKGLATKTDEPNLQHLEVILGVRRSTQTFRNNIPVGDAPAPPPVGGILK
jgi:pilus assembly protein CpaB